MKPFFSKIRSISKKISIVVFVYFIVIAFYMHFAGTGTSNISHQRTMVSDTREGIYSVINDPKLKKQKEGRLIIAAYRLAACTIMGEGCTNNPADGDKNYKDSLMGKMGGALGATYTNPPASGVYWALDSLNHVGLSPTYAAEGIGFSQIRALMDIWKAFRNVAYLLVVLAMITVGFMIMFRMKINPQTVVSLENALPRIVITLLAITFSFAIAGFLIDLMYVVIMLGISIIARGDPSLNLTKLQSAYQHPTMGDLFDSMFPKEGGWTRMPLFGGLIQLSDLGNSIMYVLPSWINDTFKTLGAGIFGLLGFNIVFNKNVFGLGGILPDALSNIGLDVLGNGGNTGQFLSAILRAILVILVTVILIGITIRWGAGWILGFIIFLTIVLLVFRLFIMLMTSYVKILLWIIFAPLYLLINVIPGRNALANWIKSLSAELSIYPITIFLLVTARLVVNVYKPDVPMWTPPFIYSIASRRLAILVGMGILFIIPDIVRYVKQSVFGVKPSPINFGLGTFFGAATAATGGGLGLLGKYGSIAHGINYIPESVRNRIPFLKKSAGTNKRDDGGLPPGQHV